MTTVSKIPTLRQFTTLLLRYVGRAACAYPYVRGLQEAGYAELGKPGRGGVKSPRVAREQAALLLLAVSSGTPAKEAISEAGILYELPFEGAVRSFTGAHGSCTLPIPLHGALDRTRFGGLIEALLGSYQLGLGPDAFHTDPCTAPFGLRFGQGERGAFAIYERQGLAPNEDGHVLHDQLVFGRPYALPARVQRSVFLPIGLIKRIGEALGPMPGTSANEVLHLRDEQLSSVGFGGVPGDFPGATLNFDTIGSA